MRRAEPILMLRFKSKYEERYAQRLEVLKRAGEILDWIYEPLSLHIGEGAWYKPDFLVLLPDNKVELHEVKGRPREAGIVRYKVAKRLYGHIWTFRYVTWDSKHKSWSFR